MENTAASIDVERQKQAKTYSRIKRRLMLLDLGVGGVYTLAWLVLGWSGALKQALLPVTTNDWLLVLLYALVFGGIYLVITLPLSYYEEYTLPHRFEMSTQTPGGWVGDQLKGLAVSGILGAVLLEIVYALLRAAPDTWWIWVSLILLVFSVLLANLAPVLLMPLFNKYTPLGEEHADLAERLIRLAERANTRVQGVYKFDMSRRTKAANAALTGLGRTRRIILGDTLISEFTPDEIETVLAHELGHQVNRDIPLLIGGQSLITLVGMYLASLALRWGAAYFGFQGPADIAALPVFALVIGTYGLVSMPLGNALTRWRERKADEYALAVTGNGPAFASALTRLANQNLAEVDPEPWEEFLLYSHPALNKRIEMAQGVKGNP
ncbi:MAG TPA: M48 family metallopeptidase [Anaerolineaceae bacterium]